MTHPVAGGRIEEIYPGVQGGVNGPNRFVVNDRAVLLRAHRPAAEADDRHLAVSKSSVLHVERPRCGARCAA